MAVLEDRILKIAEMRHRGAEDAQIAEELDLAIKTVSAYESVVRETLRRYARSRTPEKIASEIGVSEMVVRVCAALYSIELMKPSYKSKIIEEVRREYEKGADTLSELCIATGRNERTVRRYASRLGIKLRNLQSKSKDIPQLDAAIRSGSSMREMIDITGWGPAKVMSYINNRMQFPVWRKEYFRRHPD